jgi:SH3-like domain-containing protein
MDLDLRKAKELARSKMGGIILLWVVIVLIILGSLVFYMVSGKRAVAQAPTPTHLPATVTPAPTKQPTPTPQLPTPTAPPAHTVAWTNQEVGVYLRAEPNGEILLAIPNGEAVKVLEAETKTVGNLEWVQVEYDGQVGWATTEYLYQIAGEYQRVGKDGQWLFKDVEGIVLLYLWEGTPYQVVGEQRKEGWVWTKVRLVEGSNGWLKIRKFGSNETISME